MDISTQVAALLNQGGQLALRQTSSGILYNTTTYMIELDGERVIAVAGLDQKDKLRTEMKHLCVHRDYRKKGLGLKFLKKGIQLAKTNIVYGLVRSDNKVNIRNNIRAGFEPYAKYWGRNCHIIVFVARRNNVKAAKRSN